MRKRTRSILQELSTIRVADRGDDFIQTTGTNIIDSAINLLEQVHTIYDAEAALDLERRLINSIKAGSSKKFRVGVEKIKESKRK
jgi:hypothetical protein|tara:strand:- start:786 stop:1040 length:255 start_codon:yes stop_codon:yes gene_type:complete